LIFEFSISFLWGDTLLDSSDCIFQVQIKHNPIAQCCHVFTMWIQFTFIFILFHWTGARYYLILGFNISLLWVDTLFHLFHCILQVEINTLPHHHVFTMWKSVYCYSHCVWLDWCKVWFFIHIQHIHIVGRHLSSFISFHHPGRNKYNQILQCCHIFSMWKSVYIDFHYVPWDWW